MIIAPLSPTVDPEESITATAAHKSNLAIAIIVALASPYNPSGLTCYKSIRNGTELIINWTEQ